MFEVLVPIIILSSGGVRVIICILTSGADQWCRGGGNKNCDDASRHVTHSIASYIHPISHFPYCQFLSKGTFSDDAVQIRSSLWWCIAMWSAYGHVTVKQHQQLLEANVWDGYGRTALAPGRVTVAPSLLTLSSTTNFAVELKRCLTKP